jgi:hypothetical protein
MESPKKLLLILALIAAAALLPVGNASAAAPANTRVIVTLAVAADADGAAISAATDALLTTLPGGDYTVTNRYEVLPYVALSAGPNTLSVLQQSGLVAAIERDGTVTAASSMTKCKTVKARKGKKAKASKKCAAAPVVH